jgi:Undecaprenyl-phosphate glucose phosphotransferase
MARVKEDMGGRPPDRPVTLVPRDGHHSYPTPLLDDPSLPSNARTLTLVEDEPSAVNMAVTPARKSPIVLAALQVILDALMITLAFVLAYQGRLAFDIIPFRDPPKPEVYVFMIAVTVITMLVVFAAWGLYRLRRGISRIDEFYKIVAAVSFGTFGSIGVNYLLLADGFIFSRVMLASGWLLSILLVTGERVAFAWGVGQARRHGLSQQRILIVGTGEIAQAIIRRVSKHPELGVRVVGVVAPPRATEERAVWDVPVLGATTEMARVVREQRADEVIVAMAGASYTELLEIVDLCADVNVGIKIYPDAFELITERVDVGDLSGVKLISVKDVALRGWNRMLKRAFDMAFSALVLVFMSPLLLLIALLIKIDSRGPVFFIQERVGLDGKPIQVIKFRSMHVGAEQERAGWTTKDDPRRTRVGKWLRRFSLDELPQFMNVLLGEMSVVGPRPEQRVYVQKFSRTIPKYMLRHREKAGITGWAQVNGLRGDTSIEERTRLDLEYIETWSLLLDLKIIARTIVHMFRGSNAY